MGPIAPASALEAVPAHPVTVSTCDPRQNAQAFSPVYAPAYYPGGPYYGWYDVYGYRYYQPPVVQQNPTLAIDYRNVTQKTMSQVEFGLIANGHLVAEVKDVGKFSPGVEIKHEFGISPNVFPLQTGLPRCVPLRITFADGTKWHNPHLPAIRRQLYGPPPSPATPGQ
jgi:hypothetical protein